MTELDLVLFDRDGVLNELWREHEVDVGDSPVCPDQLALTPHAAEAVRRVNDVGVPCVVVSNQPGVAKGKLTMPLLQQVTFALLKGLAAGGAWVDSIYYCLHHPDAVLPELRLHCPNRKPRPGMLLQACQQFRADPSKTWMLGDAWTDIEAGAAVGCRTAWIGAARSYPEASRPVAGPSIVVSDVLEAVEAILIGAQAAFVHGSDARREAGTKGSWI
jgi:D-glycero-D-manno-heptose 1,7-bisphosphate phosphatase